MSKAQELELFKELLDKHRYEYHKLVYIIFPFGQEGTDLEHMKPYKWQLQEWKRMSDHYGNLATRDQTYRLIISSGNGAAKTAFGAMTMLMMMYTQRLRARLTANTDPQMKQIVWPEYDVWFRRARFVDDFFEKLGTSIKAKDPKSAESWRIDTVTWQEQNPASISGLHNKGGMAAYVFEEAAGIPAIIWDYCKGAFTEKDTMKLHMAFANSDDPESKFEQNMESDMWNSRRIDTRTLEHIDPKEVELWLKEAGGDEDSDDFRVRVRGLPRKSSKDSIIRLEAVDAALARRHNFDKDTVAEFPVILSCDPAWTGGDETTIWYKQGHYKCMLEKFKLNKKEGHTHRITYNKLCYWERELRADAVFIDQGEGTALYTLAMDAQKYHWELVSFANSPSDEPDSKMSSYANIRAMMYYKTNETLLKGGILDARHEAWIEPMRQQLCWTKGTRHRVTGKKLAEPKLDIKERVGKSPDIADGCVLLEAFEVIDKLPENELEFDPTSQSTTIGGSTFQMKEIDEDELYG